MDRFVSRVNFSKHSTEAQESILLLEMSKIFNLGAMVILSEIEDISLLLIRNSCKLTQTDKFGIC